MTNLFNLSDSNLHINMLLIFDLKIFLETDNFDSDRRLFHNVMPSWYRRLWSMNTEHMT